MRSSGKIKLLLLVETSNDKLALEDFEIVTKEQVKTECILFSNACACKLLQKVLVTGYGYEDRVYLYIRVSFTIRQIVNYPLPETIKRILRSFGR